MKKITLGLISLCLTFGANAQYVDFGSSYDAQQGDIAVADIDGDGDMDVIFCGTDLQNSVYTMKGAVLINDGTGNFTAQSEDDLITPGHYGKIKFGDIDGDGDLDVLFVGTGASNVTTAVGIALNDGNGNFTLANLNDYSIDQTSAISCGFADFDNNGFLDFYIFGNGLGNCAIYFQQTNGTFIKSTSSFASYNFVDPEASVVDFNNDGYVDLFVNGYLENPEGTDVLGRFSATFVNDQFGNFDRYAQPNIIQKSYGTASWGDIDGDGWMDLVLQGDGWVNSGESSDGIVRVYKNTSGTLVAKTTFSFFRQLNTGGGNVIVDWNNDGLSDIVVGGWNDTKSRQATSLFLCSDATNYTFSESTLSDTYFPGLSEHTYDVADLTGNGKVDLLMMGYNGNQSNQVGSYSRNISGYCPSSGVSSAYSKPTAPVNLTSNVNDNESMVTLSWGASSSESGKTGTTYNLSLKNTTTGKWLYNPMSIIGGTNDGQRSVTGLGNVFTNKSIELYDLPTGEYEWTVQAINGAYFGGSFATSQTFAVNNLTSSDGTSIINPVVYTGSGKIFVNTGNVSSYIHVFNIHGQSVFTCVSSENVTIDARQGIYLIEVISDNSILKTKVIVK